MDSTAVETRRVEALNYFSYLKKFNCSHVQHTFFPIASLFCFVLGGRCKIMFLASVTIGHTKNPKL